MICIIEMKEDYARATVYYQWEKSTSVTYTTSSLSTLLSNLIKVQPFPYISQCHKSISIQHVQYENSNLDIEYLYQFNEDPSLLPAPAVDIHQKMNRSQRWHSGSWDQQQDRSSQTLRKNKFMTSSLLFTSSSANSSPQLNPTTSSYPSHKMVPWANEEDEEDHLIQPKDELTIHTPYIPNLIISLPDKNEQFLQSFTQLCVNCYQHQNIYIIQIMHPQKFIQYLNQEPTETLDDEQDKPIKVKLSITKSSDEVCRVNQTEWPIKPWKSEEEEEEDDDEELPPTVDEDVDVFQDDIIPAPTTIHPVELDVVVPPEPTTKTQVDAR